MTTELARIESITPAELFKPGALDPILERIEAEVRREAACLDISTAENRKALASLAFKVAKSKTFVEARGKDLVAGRKEELKAIDRERGRVWDRFEKLQEEVRKPLTDWENAEKARVATHELALETLITCGELILGEWQTYPLDKMRAQIEHWKALDYNWQEFHSRAVTAVVKSIGQVKEAIAKREKYDAEQEELIRLRAERAKRDQQEREERIAREAEERAKAEADARAALAAKLAEQAQQRIEEERNQAEARAKQAEAQRAQVEAQAADERERAALAARDAIAASEASRKAAVEAERQRTEDARKAEVAAAEKREANKRHCAKINREVRDALIAYTEKEGQQYKLSPALATFVVRAIASDSIPHTKISY